MDQSAVAQVLSLLSNMLGVKKQQPIARKPSFDEQMAAKGWYRHPDGVYREATPSPTPQSALDQFRFKMGQKDYSWAKPQLLKLFQAKNYPPLTQYVDNFIQAGNQYGVDPRALVTIANNESSLGRSYPPQTFNPFGYLGGAGETVNQKLNAGFTSIPHAIDALTKRFVRPGTPQGYTIFRTNPTVSNLQQAYNANPDERDRYLTNTADLLPFFGD